MKVLLSIKPEFAEKIFEGKKGYEYRRVIFKRKDVDKIIVYASSPISKLIGEFEIDNIVTGRPFDIWKETKGLAGISRKYFLKYFSEATMGYAIKIKNCVRYNKPLCLYKNLGIKPPQSFAYVN